MKCNNITVLILSILIFVNLINTEKTCNCENNKTELPEDKQNNEYEPGNNNEIRKNFNENTNENDDENDEMDDTESNNESCSKLGEEECNKRKRKVGLYNRRRRPKHILDIIPFYRIPAIIYNAFKKSISYDRDTREIKDFEISNFAKELSKAFRKRHLGGFVGGLGLHVADFADHLVEVSKDVISEHQRTSRSNEEYNIFGKLSDRIKLRSAGLLSIQKDDLYEKAPPDEIELPFENLGSTVRSLIELLPSENAKHYYYKHYKPAANEIKKGLNSTKVRSLLKNAFTSDIFSISRDPKRRSTKVRFQNFKMKE